MSKHKEYSKTFGIFYDNFRRWCMEMDARGELSDKPEEHFYDFFLKNFMQSVDDATAMQLFVRDVRHELVHIYMTDAHLQDFLKQADVKDISGIKKYIADNGNNVFVNKDDQMTNIVDGKNLAFCLHIPDERQGYVLCYSLYENATSEKVVDTMESVGGVVNPHFRRGYFKRLESDFYKNKKGQIIFVHETVVNAQAKTLE